MAVRLKRKRLAVELVEAPTIPPRLQVYDPADWLSPDDPPMPTDGFDVAAWTQYEEAHQRAYQRHLAARRAWFAEHGWPSVEVAVAVPDEAFDPSTDR